MDKCDNGKSHFSSRTSELWATVTRQNSFFCKNKWTMDKCDNGISHFSSRTSELWASLTRQKSFLSKNKWTTASLTRQKPFLIKNKIAQGRWRRNIHFLTFKVGNCEDLWYFSSQMTRAILNLGKLHSFVVALDYDFALFLTSIRQIRQREDTFSHDRDTILVVNAKLFWCV